MSFIGNIVWLIFGGLPAAIGYFIGGLLFCVSIIGIPFGLASLRLGAFAVGRCRVLGNAVHPPPLLRASAPAPAKAVPMQLFREAGQVWRAPLASDSVNDH